MNRQQLTSLQTNVANCVACKDCTIRVTGPRGKLSADTLLVLASPSFDDVKEGYPLSDECGKEFHRILLETAEFDTQTDALVCCLAHCAQKKPKLSPVVARNCHGFFEQYLGTPEVKLVCALGYDVARHMFAEGRTNIPRTLIGNNMPIQRTVFHTAGRTQWTKKESIEVFVFDDPQLIREDLDAVGWDGSPKEETRIRDRLTKQARNFAKLRRRLLSV